MTADTVDPLSLPPAAEYEYWERPGNECGIVPDPKWTVRKLERWERAGVPTPISGDMTAGLRAEARRDGPPW